MNLEEVAALASELLDAADERLGAADLEWATYDHAASEARVLVSGALAMAADDAGVAALLLRHGLVMLNRLPVPTGLEWVEGQGWQGIFRRRLWVELSALGLPPPTMTAIHEVLMAA